MVVALENLNTDCQVYGFDSIEGLPEVSPDYDLDCWHEGQYKADFDSMYQTRRCKERPDLNLCKGWFSESLKRKDIQRISAAAYAHIDCDLHEPTVEVLEYLKSRLADGAVLVFDDWTWNLEKGETKVFADWCSASGLRFEFLASTMGHFYLRVFKA